jgi:hypothetical protein
MRGLRCLSKRRCRTRGAARRHIKAAAAFSRGRRIVDQLVKESLDIPTVLTVSVVNPIFEEVFVCAYVVTALRDKRPTARWT